ncbi:MAG: hypothetical protein HY329_02420 [Chloroflexi bacterium]|nr:hypothetical protein [Chloroflexota bacterium]
MIQRLSKTDASTTVAAEQAGKELAARVEEIVASHGVNARYRHPQRLLGLLRLVSPVSRYSFEGLHRNSRQ